MKVNPSHQNIMFVYVYDFIFYFIRIIYFNTAFHLKYLNITYIHTKCMFIINFRLNYKYNMFLSYQYYYQ